MFALGVELSNSKLLRFRESNVLVLFRLAGDAGDEGCSRFEEKESSKAGSLDCEERSGDQATDSGILGLGGGGGFRGTGGTGRGCRVLSSGFEGGVRICFKGYSEDGFKGEFQVIISRVKGGVKVIVKSG